MPVLIPGWARIGRDPAIVWDQVALGWRDQSYHYRVPVSQQGRACLLPPSGFG